MQSLGIELTSPYTTKKSELELFRSVSRIASAFY